jgi:hypothetical protein
MRGHFEGAQLEQAHAGSRAFGRVKFVDTELRAMGASSDIRQQVPEEAVGSARGNWLASLGDLVEGNLQLIKRFNPSFVDPRVLAGGTYE